MDGLHSHDPGAPCFQEPFVLNALVAQTAGRRSWVKEAGLAAAGSLLTGRGEGHEQKLMEHVLRFSLRSHSTFFFHLPCFVSSFSFPFFFSGVRWWTTKDFFSLSFFFLPSTRCWKCDDWLSRNNPPSVICTAAGEAAVPKIRRHRRSCDQMKNTPGFHGSVR